MAAEVANETAAAYRTHLFCDLRGYTSFLERAGNAAGAELLARYREVVRAAIAAHGGTEVSTEGDAFYVVFRSASSAVMCGMAIVEGAARQNEAHPDGPMHVGVGIHAGEVVETADTFVGTAVNVASRVCAVARPGEVLVTATVRGLTHGSVPVVFRSGGKKRLKGLTEPVEVFSVAPPGSRAPAGRTPSRRSLTVAGAVAAGVLVVAVVAALPLLAPPAPAPSPTATPNRPSATTVGPLAIGTYESARFSPRLRFVIADQDWHLYRETSDALGLLNEAGPSGRLDMGRVGRVYTDPCAPGGPSVSAGRTPDELFAALEEAPFLHVGERKLFSVGGKAALMADVMVDQGAQAACGSIGDSGINILSLGGELWSAHPGETVRTVAVANGVETILILMSNAEASATSTEALEDFFDRAARVIASMAM